MAINNITQTISTLPPAGSRGVDVQTQFVIKQEDFQDHLQGITVDELNTLKDQLNSRIGEINSTTTTMNGYADTASAGASTATTKAGEASTSASDALSYKNQAETFKNNASASATKASQWADNNYNVEVETGKYSAKHWSTVAQNTVSNKIDKVTSTDNAIVRFDGATGLVQNSGVIIDDSGNVGIGTSSPVGGNLHINSTANSNIKFTNTTTGQTVNDGLLVGIGPSGDAYVLNKEAKALSFGTNNLNNIDIDGTGSVHIRGNLIYMGSNDISVLYTDTNWGLLYKALRPNALAAEHAFFKSDGTTNLFSYNNTSGLTVNQPTGLGYGAGAGGTVTQLTSKSTNVTLNKPTGTITTTADALAAGASVSFAVFNSLFTANDVAIAMGRNVPYDSHNYRIEGFNSGAGGFGIRITNVSPVSRSEALVVNFTIIKGANT